MLCGYLNIPCFLRSAPNEKSEGRKDYESDKRARFCDFFHKANPSVKSWGRSHVYKFLVLGRLGLDFAVKKKKVKDHTIGLLLVILFCLFAQENWGESTSYDDSGAWLTDQPEFLPVDDAFQFSLERGGDGNYSLLFKIEEGYYLYKDQFDAWTYRDGERLRVVLLLPEGQKKTDEYFGEVNVFYTPLKVAMKNLPSISDTSTVIVRYQGCADRGLCYPPVEKEINLASGSIFDPMLLELSLIHFSEPTRPD